MNGAFSTILIYIYIGQWMIGFVTFFGGPMYKCIFAYVCMKSVLIARHKSWQNGSTHYMHQMHVDAFEICFRLCWQVKIDLNLYRQYAIEFESCSTWAERDVPFWRFDTIVSFTALHIIHVILSQSLVWIYIAVFLFYAFMHFVSFFHFAVGAYNRSMPERTICNCKRVESNR